MKLVIKFRDNLLIDKNSIIYNSLIITDEYIKEVEVFFQNSNRKSIQVDNKSTNDKLITKLQEKATALNNLLKANKLSGNFLFKDNNIQLINNLLKRSNNIKIGNRRRKDIRYIFPNFYNYFSIEIPISLKDIILKDIKKFIIDVDKSEHLLEAAYITTKPINHDNQEYFDSDKMDIDFSPLTIPCRGEGITVVDIQAKWHIDNSELHWPTSLPSPTLIFPSGLTITQLSDYITAGSLGNHGSKVLGVIKAEDTSPIAIDTCKGIAPNTNILLSSMININNDYVHESALIEAINNTKAGDVILITNGPQYFPLDIQPAIFQLVKLSRQLHTNVVISAGNSNTDLFNQTIVSVADIMDTTTLNGTTYWGVYDWLLNLETTIRNSDRSFEDYTNENSFAQDYLENRSRAIVVGAISAGNVVKNNTIHDSNPDLKTRKISVFAQGENITTTNYNSIIDDFGYTSGAASIIAGIIASFQSIARSKGKYINSDKLWSLLTRAKRTTSSTTNFYLTTKVTKAGSTTRIGGVPIYKNIAQQIIYDIDHDIRGYNDMIS